MSVSRILVWMRPNDYKQILNCKTPKHKNTKNTNKNVNNFLLQKYLLKKTTTTTTTKNNKTKQNKTKNIYIRSSFPPIFSTETFYVRKKFQWMFFFYLCSVSR